MYAVVKNSSAIIVFLQYDSRAQIVQQNDETENMESSKVYVSLQNYFKIMSIIVT